MLTVRELACLQSFPLDWEFTGTRLDSYSSKRVTNMTQFGQVGNAVPPQLAYALAVAIKEQFFTGVDAHTKSKKRPTIMDLANVNNS